jgi:uncharacterized membrane protein YtjA (UPF0391 family)
MGASFVDLLAQRVGAANKEHWNQIGRSGYQRRSVATTLLKWALIFLVVSLVAALFGFTGISAASADIARVLFFIFLVIFVMLLVLGLMAGRRV